MTEMRGVWIRWIVGGIVTVSLAGVSAYAGMKAGIAEADKQIAIAQTWQESNIRRLDRIEDKVDRLIERTR